MIPAKLISRLERLEAQKHVADQGVVVNIVRVPQGQERRPAVAYDDIVEAWPDETLEQIEQRLSVKVAWFGAGVPAKVRS